MSEPKILKVVTGLKPNGTTINSKGADYAVIGKWADGNTSNQDRKGLFVKLDSLTDGMTMSIAGPEDNIRGIITSTPAYCENAQPEYFDEEGNLKTGYDYVGILGVVSTKDDGTLAANDYCMPDSTGKAVKVTGTYGYQVIDRVDSTHVRVIVEPGADSDYHLSKSAADNVVLYEDQVTPSTPIPLNADMLGGRQASEYALKGEAGGGDVSVEYSSTVPSNTGVLTDTNQDSAHYGEKIAPITTASAVYVPSASTTLNNMLTITTATLTAGATEITITDSRVTTDSALSFYTSVYGVNPTEVSVATGSVTLTFDAQDADMTVGVRVDG